MIIQVNPIIAEPTKIIDVPFDAIALVMLAGFGSFMIATTVLGSGNSIFSLFIMFITWVIAYRICVRIASRDPNFVNVLRAISLRHLQKPSIAPSDHWISQTP
jgi:type IV secretory pathway TrbD component